MTVYTPKYSVVLQEIPDHISIGIMCSGCKLKCPTCSYKSFKETYELSLSEYKDILLQHQGLCSAVAFMGGEWNGDFTEYLRLAKDFNFMTCLYTGLEYEDINLLILAELDYIKVGRWTGIQLGDENCNQRFIEVKTGLDLSYKFKKF